MIQGGEQQNDAPVRRMQFALVLLMLAHIPSAYRYFVGLYSLTHYQFFPVALLSFVILFWFRKSKDERPLTGGMVVLLLLDLLGLAAGVHLNSPWLSFTGMVLGLFALTAKFRDEGYDRHLAYLAILPAITVRLPLNMDTEVIHWLQRATTAASSRFLDQIGVAHQRNGNILELPGKTLLVSEACSGVQSLFAVLFIAALMVCVSRRSFVHSLVLILSGFVFAGAMNVMRVSAIAISWDFFRQDFSEGTRHEILGYVCMLLAAGLIWSMDSLLSFFLDPVPEIRPAGPTGAFRHPITSLWNWCFYVHRIDPSMQGVPIHFAAKPQLRESKILLLFAVIICVVAVTFQMRG